VVATQIMRRARSDMRRQRLGVGVLQYGREFTMVDVCVQVGVHAFDSVIIALGVCSVLRRLLPLHLLGRLRYFVHACGTACGVHYVVRLACRLGVGWASDRWVQLHAAAVASGLLVCLPNSTLITRRLHHTTEFYRILVDKLWLSCRLLTCFAK
jgi:hypothetical protein